MNGASLSTWPGVADLTASVEQTSQGAFMIDLTKRKLKIIPTVEALVSPVLRDEMTRQPIPVPDKPARITKSTGSTYEVFGIHGISRDEANHLIVALDRVPHLRYIAIDLMRLVHPLLSEEDYSDE